MNILIFIAAIAMVESGNNPAAVGKAGELSEYQITRQVWKAYAPAEPGRCRVTWLSIMPASWRSRFRL